MSSLNERFKTRVRPRLVDAYSRFLYQSARLVRRREGLVGRAEQMLLQMRWRELLATGNPALWPPFEETGFRSFSQTDEDGKLLYLFTVIGTTNRRVLEVCASDGIEANATNLLVHHGWEGLLFDGDPIFVAIGQRFYASCRDTQEAPPKFVQAWITRENINELIGGQGWSGEIDLFALDIDGMDYWVWEAMEVVQPRVVIAEYIPHWGPEEAKVVPYRADFHYAQTQYGFDYTGASLAAYTKLAERKGYRLVGANRIRHNAFFVREGLGEETLPEVTVASCLDHPRIRTARERFPRIAALEWVEV